MHDEVRAQLERLLQDWRAHAVVDHNLGLLVGRVGDRRDRLDVVDVQLRVRRRLEKDQARLGPFAYGALPVRQPRAVDVVDLDPELRDDVVQQPEGRAEDLLGGDDAVALAAQPQDAGQDRAHAAREGQAVLGALERRQTLLEGPDAWIGVARVDVAALALLETLGRILRAREDEARGQVQGLGVLAVRRARRACAHCFGLSPLHFAIL